jgi:hypothetical protein
MLTALAHGAAGTDSVTGLPVPDAASGMSLDTPMKIDPVQVCKSMQTSNFYVVSGAKTSTVIAWYAAHLKGFRHMHAYASGRAQDGFVNADGSLLVGITGSPAADGADSGAYAVTYVALKPGASDKVLTGLMTQHLSC